MKKILVTGADGQLGRCFQKIASQYPSLDFIFLTKNQLDIEKPEQLSDFFQSNAVDYCINAAGYTNVEKAESEVDRAYAINAEASKTVAIACHQHNVVLFHLSTDYVFDGETTDSYVETAPTNPLNVYGKSKLLGESNIKESGCNYFIIRTSWLYSEFNNNFMNTVLECAKTGKDMTITTTQTGSPTNANDLAAAILHIILTNNDQFGLYHFSNSGTATWYDFAYQILSFSNQLDSIKLAKTEHYRTFAARPKYSVLNTTLFENTFNYKINDWESSLAHQLAAIKK